MGGVPSRACRRFVRRLADAFKLPVYVFTDGDPYGYFNIYRTLKVGSGNAAHLNEFFCVPQARYLGVTPYDVEAFDLRDCTHPLQQVDIKRAQDALKKLMQGRTSIVIAHRLSTIQDVDRILVLRKGKLIEQGTHAELLKLDGGYYRKLYELQYQEA